MRVKPAAKYRCTTCNKITIVTDSMGEDGRVIRYRKCPGNHRMKTIEVPYKFLEAATEERERIIAWLREESRYDTALIEIADELAAWNKEE